MSVEQLKGLTVAPVLQDRGVGAPVQQTGERRGDPISPAAQTVNSSQAADTLNLTKKAEALQSVEAALANSSTVDLSRVKEVRERIQAGQYEINHQRLANKVMNFELMRNDISK